MIVLVIFFFVFFFGMIIFIQYGKVSKRSPGRVVEMKNEPSIKKPFKPIETTKPIFRKGAMAYHRKPRSMIFVELHYYRIKPNLQWWIDNYGEKIFDTPIQMILDL
jgi:hypothetical protein